MFYQNEFLFFIKNIQLSEQLAYILGFSGHIFQDTITAKFTPDMSGGVSSLYIYTPGLIEPVIVGDTLAPVLRIVNIRGTRDEIVEDTYVAVQYHKLLVKEISEIRVEIRSSNGQLIPFDYGTCMLTLNFKKDVYF